ncbi:hypothetical protein Tam10B_0753 [Bifidobacterium vansinderenii]|uniref:Uncharacterized protein n=1 Tax=Bifidobacterium vansinderenii TaxID=1984871 RepID=A0A229VYV1_9BIFI|nr:hypothetical protein Tam10B_0753 [Bifidobacterium vansinderenii]
MPRRRTRTKHKSLEDRYLSELGQGGQRDDMLHALCRIADQLTRIGDRLTEDTPNGHGQGQ